MQLKISKQEYKSHPFPVCILLNYLILSIISIVLIGMLAGFIVYCGLSGFLDKLAGIAVVLLVGGGLCFLVCLVLPTKINKRKIYRGIGIMRFLLACAILCPTVFLALIVILNVLNIHYIFFDVVTLFVECAIPFLLSLKIRHEIKSSIFICPDCGLINSYELEDKSVVDLGTRHKFHNEGGYRHTWKTSVGVMVEDVPTTAVYDGEFRKMQTTSRYKCSVCKNIKNYYQTTETRID